MPVRAVVVPATPLLLAGAAGTGVVLEATRKAVRGALAELLDAAAVRAADRPDVRAAGIVVVAHGHVSRSGRLRPSLAAAGIADRWVPALRGGPAVGSPGDDGMADVPASVALLALADAIAAGGGEPADVQVVELPQHPAPQQVSDAAALVRGAAGVVVAGGGRPGGLDARPEALSHGVAAVLDTVITREGWVAEVRTVAEDHEHLPREYRVTLLHAPG